MFLEFLVYVFWIAIQIYLIWLIIRKECCHCPCPPDGYGYTAIGKSNRESTEDQPNFYQ